MINRYKPSNFVLFVYYFESYFEDNSFLDRNEIIKLASFPLSFSRSWSCGLELARWQSSQKGNVGMSIGLPSWTTIPFLATNIAPDDITSSCRSRHDPSRNPIVRLVILITYPIFRIFGKSKAKSKSTRFQTFYFSSSLRSSLHNTRCNNYIIAERIYIEVT